MILHRADRKTASLPHVSLTEGMGTFIYQEVYEINGRQIVHKVVQEIRRLEAL